MRKGRPAEAERIPTECVEIDEDMVLIQFNLGAHRDGGMSNGREAFVARLSKSRRKRSRALPGQTSGVRDARCSARVALRVKVEWDNDQGTVLGRTENIGVGGVFVTTNQELKVGRRVGLRFRLPGSQDRVRVNAEVRWVKTVSPRLAAATGAGLRFVESPPDVSAAIDRFVRDGEIDSEAPSRS
jgi:uncharacterized protein (TIGR02266 family)